MLDTLLTYPQSITFWLVFTALLFSIGLYGIMTRRNAIGVLMSAEILLNSAALNFVIFNRHVAPVSIDGHLMAMFIVAVAAAEVILAMAIFLTLFKTKGGIDVTHMNLMRN
jgi:NADH:ubiquinone oxidoreductase subunit K